MGLNVIFIIRFRCESVARVESFPAEVVRSLWRLNTRQSLVGITGHDVGTIGCYEMEIDVGAPETFRHPVWIARGLNGLNVDVVLGQDVLRDRQINLFMAQNEARCQDRSLPFLVRRKECKNNYFGSFPVCPLRVRPSVLRTAKWSGNQCMTTG